MQFRWIAAITLWTILSGPIFSPRPACTPARDARTLTASPASPRAAAQPAPTWADKLFQPARR